MTYIAGGGVPASPVGLVTSVAVPAGADGWTGNILSLQSNRAGQWLAIAACNQGAYGHGARLANSAGTFIGSFNGNFWAGTPTANPRAVDWVTLFMNNGDSVYGQAARGSVTGNTLWLYLYFIPTQAYPK